MTSSARFDSGPDACPKCQGPLTWRQPHGYPVVEQILFGVSFIAFLVLFEKVKAQRSILWTWSIVQLVLGALLMRGRVRARKRILRCIRCGAAIP